MKNGKRAVLFDLDGTLVNSLPGIAWGVNSILTSVRMRALEESEIEKMVGKGVRVLWERVCEARMIFATDQLLDSLIRRFAEVMDSPVAPGAQYFPGTIEAIEALRSEGVKVALVTNKLRSMTECFLERSRTEDLFDEIVCGDDTAHAKPAGDMVLLACRKLGVAPGEAVMVGDSGNDALAARAAGVDVVLVSTGYNEGKPIDVWAQKNGFNAPLSDVKAVVESLF